MNLKQSWRNLAVCCSVVLLQTRLFAAQVESTSQEKPVVFTTQQDHDNMLKQLGISKLRPGRNGDANAANGANYNEEEANPYPNLPDVLKTQAGEAVTTAEQWQNVRRPEIVEMLQREVYGRVPDSVPEVKWEIRETREIKAGGKDAIQQHIVGVVDNSACPKIEVSISMSLTLPKDATEPVPVLMTFGWTPFEPSPFNLGGRGGRGGGQAPRPPGKEDKLIAAGWGSVVLNPNTVQADAGGFQKSPFSRNPNADATPVGAGLTRGIIGLTNLGQPRKPDDWGAIRAWGWGASRALDYLETRENVDAKRVGIAGVSRYGKAALVAMAFDERFGMGLIASSGAGGTKLFRRNFGESLENLAGSGAYHWMAGNYIKYSAEESGFGRRTADDLPVDSHMTLALCAPRLTFISHGIPERGDAHWLDHQGSFMAAIASQPVYRLLGAKDLGRSDDYQSEKMPAVNVDMLDGELAWRQHDGGHTDEPNVTHFIRWADRHFGRPEVDLTFPDWNSKLQGSETAEEKSDGSKESDKEMSDSAKSAGKQSLAIQRTDANSVAAHQQLVAKAKQGKIDVYFVGDSITRRWGATDYPELLANWKKHFHGWNAANFGWGGDSTSNILWRLENGEFAGLQPKVIVLQAGTNNLPWTGPADQAKVDEVVEGLFQIVDLLQTKSPDSEIVLVGLFPRTQNLELKSTIEKINQQLAEQSVSKQVRFLNINDQLSNESGALLAGLSTDGLHLEAKAYDIWAGALKPILTEILGERSKEDHAPPATGNPAAK